LRIKVSLTLEEIFTGIAKKVKYKKEIICTTCNGSGGASESSVETCTTCQGSGWVQKVKNTIVGTVISQEQCQNCGGSGKIIRKTCPSCSGRKVTIQDEVVELTIPRSVKNGDVLSLAFGGNVSRDGGPNGNLLVLIEEEINKDINRQESELFSKIDITIYEAIFGKEIEVKTIEGGVARVVIPPGTQSGQRLRIKEKGLYKMGTNYRGDFYLDVIVFIPSKVSDEEKEILEKIKESDSFKSKK
jgi:molecular chaperone DnaJ